MAVNTEDIEILFKELEGKLGGKTENLERLYDSLQKKIDNALMNGLTANDRLVQLLTSNLNNIKSAIDTQREAIKSFYDEMKELAGSEDILDPEELKKIFQYRIDYMRERERLEKKRLALQLEENKPQAQQDVSVIQRYTNDIISLQDKLSNLGDKLRREFGKGSLADRQIRNFTSGDQVFYANGQTNQEAEEKRLSILNAINTSQRTHIVNLEEIRREEEASREGLSRNLEIWNAIKAAARSVKAQIVTGGSYWLKYNAQAISDAKRLGITSKESAIAYQKTLMENSKELSRSFGMTAEQAMKIQDTYTKVTGRAAMLTKSQMDDIAASSKLMGEETVQSAIKMMDSIGTTSQSTTEFLDRNFARAVNSGLDTVKASEEFVKNMSLANRLSFRNGVDGISKMTIMSQTIKMNLQEVANVADKFSTIEGAIEGAAQLQMLGGPVGMLGNNPMELLYESLSDPEALFNRMKDMASTQAVFNRRTGEAEIDPMTLAFMKEQEKALGVSPGTLIGSAKQQAKIRDIEADWRRAQPSAFQAASTEARAAVANKAEYDKDKGTWVVRYLDKHGDEKVVDMKDLTEASLAEITKDNIEPVEDIRQSVRKIAGELIGTKERWNSMKDQFRTSVAQLIHPVMNIGDQILTAFNGGRIWKAITDGAFGTFGALATIGVFNFAKTLALPKLTRMFNRHVLGGLGHSSLGRNLFRGGNRIPVQGTGINPAGETLNASRTGWLRNIVRAKNAMRGVGGLAKAGGAVLSIGGGVLVGIDEWSKASDKLESANEAISMAGIQRNARRNVYDNTEIARMRTAAKNRASEDKAGAIGAGVGTAAGGLAGMAAGAAAGAAVGSFIPIFGNIAGAIVGAAVGGLGAYLGGKYGKKIGRSMASRDDDDVINRHLNEINKGDEEDNIRKIVLPVESIDYNVSLIANKLGVRSASPVRGNIYIEAEAKGEKVVDIVGLAPGVETVNTAEGKPLEAQSVNQVDSQVMYASNMYQPKGPISLNIGGSIDLNIKGAVIGKLTANDFTKVLNENQWLMRELVESITNQINRNSNNLRFNGEGYNRHVYGADSYKTQNQGTGK